MNSSRKRRRGITMGSFLRNLIEELGGEQDKHGRIILKEVINWGDLGVDGWIILGLISRRWDVCMWTGLGWPGMGTGGGRL